MELEKLILFMLICTASSRALPSSIGCPDGFMKRIILENGTVATPCCHPILNQQCGPNHEVRFCQEDRGVDTCQPCPAGFVQPHPSDSYSRQPCVKDSSECAEEAVLVVEGGTNTCRCDVSRGYCGDPTNCLLNKVPCREGFVLHAETCKCVAPPRPDPAVPGVMTTPESVEAPPTTPAKDGTRGAKESTAVGDATQGPPSSSTALQPASTGPGDSRSTVQPDPATSRTDGGGYLGLGLGLGLGIPALIAILLIIRHFWKRKHGRETSYGSPHQVFLSVYNWITVKGDSSQGSHQGEENQDGGAQSSEMTAVKTSTPVQENRAPEQEEEGPGDSPDKPFLPPHSDCHSLHQPSSPRA